MRSNQFHNEEGSISDWSSRMRGNNHGRSLTPRPLRMIDLVYGALLFLLLLHFYSLSEVQPLFAQDPYMLSNPTQNQDRYAHSSGPSEQLRPLKPWESNPPKPVSLMSTRDPFILQRHLCIKAVRERQLKIFDELLEISNSSSVQHMDDLQLLLVDPAYHSNVGDHMLTMGELELIQGTLLLPAPQQCHYVQAAGHYEVCTDVIRASDPNQKNKVALWHAGGNWGDLWPAAQDVRIPSFRTILKNGYKIIGLPQSLFYLDESLKMKDIVSMKEKIALGLGLVEEEFEQPEIDGWGHGSQELQPRKPVNTSLLETAEGMELARSRTIFTWREKESYIEALQLYPFAKNVLVPDMAFQLGPYVPIRNRPKELVDILVFLRDDKESKVASQRNEDYIRSILPKSDLTFRIVDWPSRLDIFGTNDFYFTDTAIELLSLGKVVVCDRLHAAILSYLVGLPFVYIDQVSGKVTKTLTAAFDGMGDCLDAEKAQWARALSLPDAITKASDMIDGQGLTHGQ